MTEQEKSSLALYYFLPYCLKTITHNCSKGEQDHVGNKEPYIH